jgi:hypothetical protein
MGDVGSGFLGTFLAVMPLLFPTQLRGLVFLPVAMALWPYIYDPLLSVIRRAAGGHNPLQPHREFLFHRLVRSGVSHARVAMLYGLLSLSGGAAGIAMLLKGAPADAAWLAPLGVFAMAVGLTYATESRCARVGLEPVGGLDPAAAEPVKEPLSGSA